MSFLSLQNQEEMSYLLKTIPDVGMRTTDSSFIKLSALYTQKPIILTLAYSRCPGVCNPYLLQLRDHVLLQGISENKFQMVVLSFDSKDDPAQLHKLAGLSSTSAPPANWTFGVIEDENKTELLTSLGFQTKTVDELYDHNTVLVLIGKDGKIRQWIEGLPDNQQWERLFKELSNDFVPVYSTLTNNVWTSCFQYDPSSGTWRMNWGLLMILAPSVITVLIIILLQKLTTQDRLKNNSSKLTPKQI